MKKRTLRKILPFILTIGFILCIGIRYPIRTYAAGVSIDASADSVTVGQSVTVTVTFYGEEMYSCYGYISCDGIFTGPTGPIGGELDGVNSASYSFTFQAVGEGAGSIYVGDCEVAVQDDNNPPYYVSGQGAGGDSCYITVLGNDNGSGGTGGGAGGWDYNDNYSYDWGTINGYEVGEGSGNTNLASLEVVGYTLTDEGNGIYSVVVSGSVDKITINATPEDPAAVVEGTGEKTLAEGDNFFEIVVHAENGLAQGYALKVTRRGEKIALADLLKELKETKAEQVKVSLKDGDKLTKEMIDAIVKWGKTVKLNRYDADGKLLYGWTMNGKDMAELKSFQAFDPTVTFESKNADKIEALSNYASGKVLSFAYSGELPKNTIFTIAAGKEFSKEDVLYLYYFDEKENTLTQEGQSVTVKGEEIELTITHCSEYLLTQSVLKAPEPVKQGNSRKDLLMMIAIAVELAAIIALAVILLRKRQKPVAATSSKDHVAEMFAKNEEELPEGDVYEITDLNARNK